MYDYIYLNNVFYFIIWDIFYIVIEFNQKYSMVDRCYE